MTAKTYGRASGFLLLVAFIGCRQPQSLSEPESDGPIRLVDEFNPDAVKGRADGTGKLPDRTEWRFDSQPPDPPPDQYAETRGWEPGPEVADLQIENGLLAGRSTGEWPLIRVERTEGLDDPDTLHAVEVRMRVSGGANLSVTFRNTDEVDLAETVEKLKDDPFSVMTTPIVAGEEMRTYTLTSPFTFWSRDLKHLIIRPTDAAEATFEIESVRLIFRREHLARIPSGIGWQGLMGVYRETIVSRSPEEIRMDVTLPARPWLDLAVGTVDHEPATFCVRVRPVGGAGASSDGISRRVTVTKPHRWQHVRIDLSALAGRKAEVILALEANEPGVLGFWGSPVVRNNRAPSLRAAGGADSPQGVILIMADTLRRDHLNVYGYHRETAPVLHRMAAEGALFRDCLTQATWTKVSTPSIMTGLYPFSHTVIGYTDKLPASATTLAEVFRDAGYATLSLSSILFTGKLTNLHQGFEELHESKSLPDRKSSKTAREYVDRLLPWLEAHREVPFFVFLHISDPHDPFEPAPPYDTLWADAAQKDTHYEQTEKVKEFIKDPLMKQFVMPSREELIAAEIDPDEYISHARDWYDGSIRAMDAEIGRVFEALENLGLEDDTLVVFTSDHGEEFLEHGRMFHGQSVYGELNQVPFIVRAPGLVRPGTVIGETVETIDIMPTMLELCRLPFPAQMQGRSLAPLLHGVRLAGETASRAAFTQKVPTKPSAGPPPWESTSYAIVLDGWKLIENLDDEAEEPSYELFDHKNDPLDQADVAAERPEVVEQLRVKLAEWRARAETEQLVADSETEENLSTEELERLRALGYMQ